MAASIRVSLWCRRARGSKSSYTAMYTRARRHNCVMYRGLRRNFYIWVALMLTALGCCFWGQAKAVTLSSFSSSSSSSSSSSPSNHVINTAAAAAGGGAAITTTTAVDTTAMLALYESQAERTLKSITKPSGLTDVEAIATEYTVEYTGCPSKTKPSSSSSSGLATATTASSSGNNSRSSSSGSNVYTWETGRGWTSGFYPGMLWMLYNATGGRSPDFARAAATLTAGQAPQENNTGTHDVGFMVYDSFGKGLEYGGNFLDANTRARYSDALVKTAHSLAMRYNPVVGMTRSWGNIDDNTHFEVIIDNLMNLELLFQAARATQNATLRDIAVNTALNMGRHWIRPDGSTFHLVVFDPRTGSVISRSGTPQGYAVNSTWARGQAWGVYGFTMAYRYTKDPRFLAFAQNVTSYYLRGVSSVSGGGDYVPHWDFDAPSNEAYKDTSAAAIVASALQELAQYVPSKSEEYLAAAHATLASLTDPSGPYNYAANPSASLSVLSHCRHDCDTDGCVVVEADYYLLEALLRSGH